jgi:hypothetical protein
MSIFTKDNFNKGKLNALMSGAGTMIGGTLSGELSSRTGKAFQGLGTLASALPGPWGAVAGAGLNVVGGLVNRAFGSKINDSLVQESRSATNKQSNMTFAATNNDDLLAQSNFGILRALDKSEVGSDGWFSSKASRLTAELNKEREWANKQALGNYNNAIENVDALNDMRVLSNYAAYGGPLEFGTGAIGYDFTNQYLNSKNNTSLGLNNNLVSMPNSFQGLDIFAFGGELNTQGADFTNGLLHINNGGSHESNPYEGVPMGSDNEGVPNLVEEGETVFNDYVFSNRIAVPKAIRDKYKLRGNKELTFAEASKKIAKESEERPNDPISKRGLEASMKELMMTQEMIKEKDNRKKEVNKFVTGGPLNPTEDDYYIPLWKRNIYDGTLIEPTFTKEDKKDNEEKGKKEDILKPRDTSLRYAPAVGLGLMTLTDALGITNKPKYNNADAIINLGVKSSSAPPKVGWSPINNYLRYNPFDTMFYANQLAAQANAARRAIINNSNGNRMTAIAGLLGSDYNYQKNLSNLYREAEEYNLEQRQKVEDFNRATNMANAEGFMKAALANQDAEMKARSLGLEAQMAGYKMREATRLAAEEDRAANLSGFITALGNIGRDNAILNQRDFAIRTSNTIRDEDASLVGYRGDTGKAKGGKLKKRKRGLTY